MVAYLLTSVSWWVPNCLFSVYCLSCDFPRWRTSQSNKGMFPPDHYLITISYAVMKLVGRDPFYQQGLTLIMPWISNYNHYKMWYQITNPFPLKLWNGYAIVSILICNKKFSYALAFYNIHLYWRRTCGMYLQFPSDDEMFSVVLVNPKWIIVSRVTGHFPVQLSIDLIAF